MTQVGVSSVIRNQPYLLYYVRTSAPYIPRAIQNVQKAASSPSVFSPSQRTPSPQSRPGQSSNGRPNGEKLAKKFKPAFEPKDRVISAFNRPQEKKTFIGPSQPVKNAEKRKSFGIVF